MADAKEYEENGVRFSVAQVEERSPSPTSPKREQLLAALGVARQRTRIVLRRVAGHRHQHAELLPSRGGQRDFLRSINYPELTDHTWLLGGVVSRKKQLLPYLTECLARVL